jgi:hypothetical protein
MLFLAHCMFFNIDDRMNIKLAIALYVIASILLVLTAFGTRVWPLSYSDFLGVVNKLPVYFWASIVIVYGGLLLAYYSKNVPVFISGIIFGRDSKKCFFDRHFNRLWCFQTGYWQA